MRAKFDDDDDNDNKTGLNTEQVSAVLTNPRDALYHGKRAANKGGCSV